MAPTEPALSVAAVDQLERRDGMRREELRAAAIIGERHDCRNSVLLAHGGAEAGLHAPDGEQHPGGHAVGSLDLVEECCVRLLERTALGNDRGPAASSHEGVDRAAESLLGGTVGPDGPCGVFRAGKRCKALLLDAGGLCLVRQTPLSTVQIRQRCCRMRPPEQRSSEGMRRRQPPQQSTFLQQ